jgi:predicted DNA-binding transcriptional regulator AlpA
MNEYLTESELAKELQMSRQTLLALRKDGLPYRKVRGVIRYVPEEVDAWLSVHCQGERLSNNEPMER